MRNDVFQIGSWNIRMARIRCILHMTTEWMNEWRNIRTMLQPGRKEETEDVRADLEKWRCRIGVRLLWKEKYGRKLLSRPKLTKSCSANRRRKEEEVRLDDDENPFDSPLRQSILQEYSKITLLTLLSWPWLFGDQSEPKKPHNAIQWLTFLIHTKGTVDLNLRTKTSYCD